MKALRIPHLRWWAWLLIAIAVYLLLAFVFGGGIQHSGGSVQLPPIPEPTRLT